MSTVVHSFKVMSSGSRVEGDLSRAVDSLTLPTFAAPSAGIGTRPLPGRSFSAPVADALSFTTATQAAEIAALQRLAAPGGWLLRAPEVR